MTDLQQYLRLEVERDPDPGELINLIPNPDGALGAWGWETPVAGSTMRANVTSGIRFLTYQSPGGVPSYFRSVPVEVDAGKWVSARWTAIAVAGQHRATIEWLNASKAVIGSTTQSPAYAQSSTARAYGSFQAPAGTFYARLRFDHYDGSGGNPTAGVVSILGVVLTAADTAGELGWTRTNLCTNPSAEAGTTGWAAENGVLDTTSNHAWTGSKSFRVTKEDGKTGSMAAYTTIDDIVPGRDYALQVRSRPGAVARQATVAARWLDAAGKQIAQVTVRVASEALGIWTVPLSGVVTAPTTADRLQLRISWAQVPEGERHFFDAAMVEQASKVSAYFDGDTADVFGITHEWTGAAGLSTSLEIGPTGDPGVLVPVPYQNILGPTSQISVDREELNVGSMSVKLFDAVLDPTQSDLIATGKRIRLLAIPPAIEDGETPDPQVLFAGKVFTGSVTYHLLHADERKRAEVTLTAVDPINPLANTPSREGVANIVDLPHVLEAAGVPWSVNGNGNQVANPTVVAYNDNASALDQVAVTRDSALGYAWVDRNGVLQAWDRAELDTTVAAALDEATYTADLNIDFDLETLINSVTVKVLRVIATTGATEEVSFGPYVHAESFRKYGEHAKEFVVQGIDAADTVSIQQYAEAILEVNALPRLRVNELVLPIAGDRVEGPNLNLGLLDLYDLVSVSNDRAGINEAARVTRIHHEITATSSGGTWRTTLRFTADGSVAPSTSVPAPPPSVGDVKDELDETIEGVIQTANGKNSITGATRAPTSADPGIEGDTWYHFVGGNISAVYTYTSGAWVSRKLRDETIDTLSVGKIAGLNAAFLNATIDYLTSVDITSSTFATSGGSYNFTLGGDAIAWSGGAYIAKGPTGVTVTDGGTAAVTVDSNSVDVFGIANFNGGVALNGNDLSGADVIGANRVNSGDVYVTNTPSESGTGLGAVYMGSGGRLRLSSSAAKYKTNIEPLDIDVDRFLELEPVTYDPIDGEDVAPTVGFIADQAHDLGFTHLVGYRDREIETLHYERVSAYQQAVLRELWRQNAELRARIEALEAQ